MKNKWRRKLAALGAFIALASFVHDHKYDSSNYAILHDDEAYACYSDGLIYIGDKEFLESVCPEKGDILVLDGRFDDIDPDMKIYDSYLITDKDIRNEILEVLLEYERENPSPWNRSIESMRLEWFYHNYSFVFKYRKSSASDVDFNNDDEEKYDSKILRKIFHI